MESSLGKHKPQVQGQAEANPEFFPRRSQRLVPAQRGMAEEET